MASKKAAKAREIPNRNRNNLTVNNQKIPSRLRPKIMPGILTKPHEAILTNQSPTKLLLASEQKTRAKTA